MQRKEWQNKAILARFILQTRKYTSQPHKIEQRARERAKTGVLALPVVRPSRISGGKGDFVTAVLLSTFRRRNYQHSGGYYQHFGNGGS